MIGRVFIIAMGLSVLLACAGNSNKHSAQSAKLADSGPSLSVFGFSCELGGKKCRDRRVGREMRNLVVDGLGSTGAFYAQEENGGVRKHLLDVSDMLWISGGTEILPDLVEHSVADYVAYGRVFHYEQVTRLLKVEVTLVNRSNGNRMSRIGEGQRGSLEAAVSDAVHKLSADLSSFL